jgi:hypothetical protein
MSKIEQEKYLISCFNQLKSYADQNVDEIDYVLSIMKYRLQQLESAAIAKYQSNISK